MTHKCRHAGCDRVFRGGLGQLSRHLANDHQYTNAQYLEACYPGSAEKYGEPKPDMPAEWEAA